MPVLDAPGFFDEVADEDVGAVGGDVELGDFGAFYLSSVSTLGRLGDDVGFFGGQVAVIDREFAFVRVGLKAGFGAEDEVFAAGGEVLGDVAFGFG